MSGKGGARAICAELIVWLQIHRAYTEKIFSELFVVGHLLDNLLVIKRAIDSISKHLEALSGDRLMMTRAEQAQGIGVSRELALINRVGTLK